MLTPTTAPSQTTKIAWALMAMGAALRLALYAHRPSMGQDEVGLAVNLVRRSYIELLSPLDFGFIAPFGFLWVEHAVSQSLGAGELSLRLFPLLSGLLSMPLVWLIAKRLAGPWPAVLAAGWISFSPACLRYSNEVKQYGIELFVTAALLAAASGPGLSERLTLRRFFGLAVFGCLAIEFSSPAIYVLSGIAVWLFVRALVGRLGPAELARPCILFLLWSGIFALVYFTLYAPGLPAGGYMDQFWIGSQLLHQSGVLGSTRLILDSLINPFAALDGRANAIPSIVSALLLGAGILQAFRRRDSACLLLIPLALPVLASFTNRWIFSERLMLYAVPCTLALMAWGLSPLFNRANLGGVGRLSYREISGISLAGLALWFFPLKADIYQIRHSGLSLRDGVQFALSVHRPGDVVYLYNFSVAAWLYYSVDWRGADRTRADWLTQASNATGPNGGNRQSRSEPVHHEGFDLTRPYDRGSELVGIADGVFRSSLGPANRRPDPGWAENEMLRIRSARGTGRVIFLALSPGRAGSDLLEYLLRSGARRTAGFEAPGALAAVLDFPPRNPQQ